MKEDVVRSTEMVFLPMRELQSKDVEIGHLFIARIQLSVFNVMS